MLRFLWNLIVGKERCSHVWEIYQKVDKYDPDEDPECQYPLYFEYHLVCKKCGDMTCRRF